MQEIGALCKTNPGAVQVGALKKSQSTAKNKKGDPLVSPLLLEA